MKCRTFLLVLGALALAANLAQAQRTEPRFHCPVTQPNGEQPPPNSPPGKYPDWMRERNRAGDSLVLPADTRPEQKFFHGNGKLWTVLSPRKISSGYSPALSDDQF